MNEVETPGLVQFLSANGPMKVAESAALGEIAHRVLLNLHGLGAVAAGILLVFDSMTPPRSPSFALTSELPFWPWPYGIALALAGAGLVVCRVRGKAALLGTLSLGFMCLWYAAYSATFVMTFMLWANGELDKQPYLQPFATYGLLAILSGTHLYLLRVRARKDLGGRCDR